MSIDVIHSSTDERQNSILMKFWNEHAEVVDDRRLPRRLLDGNKLVRLIAVTVCGAANVNKTKDTAHPQG